MSAVRCSSCGWTGNRKSDLPLNAALTKGCPQCAGIVRVGSPPPTTVATTPSGIEIAFWDEFNVETGLPQQRRYKVNGEVMPSATTILRVLAKDALLDWAAKLAREGIDWRETRNKAADRGSNTHDLVLRALLRERTSLADLPDEHRPYGQAAFRWLRSRKPKVLDAECMVASLEHGYTGRFDLFAELAAARARVDFKTVTKWSFYKGKLNPPFPENALQLDLYEGAAVESGYPPADHGLVVRLGPDGRFEETPVELDPERGLRVLGAYRARAEAVKALSYWEPEWPKRAVAA